MSKIVSVQNWPSVQNWQPCKNDPPCKTDSRANLTLYAKKSLCSLVPSCNFAPSCNSIFVQIYLRAIWCTRVILDPCNLVPSCIFVFVQFRPCPVWKNVLNTKKKLKIIKSREQIDEQVLTKFFFFSFAFISLNVFTT